MATKLPKAHKAPAKGQPEAQEPQASDLDILHPERTLTLGGKGYTIREYANLEWMRLLVNAEPLVAILTDFVADKETKTKEGKLEKAKRPSFEDVLLIFSQNLDHMLPLLLQSADMSREEYEVLAFFEMESLLATWWGVNHHFFIQRAQMRASVQIAEKRGALQGMAKSTQP